MTEPILRRYEPGDEDDLNALYNKVFAENRSLATWRWKYDQGPHAQPSLTAVIEDDDQIVGQYSSSTLSMVYRGRTMIGTQPMDTAIRPDYQGRRLIKPLFQAWVSLDRAAGVAFAFGFPNPLHYKVGKRLLRYLDVGPVMLLHYYVNPGLVLSKLSSQPVVPDVSRRLGNWLHRHLRLFRQGPAGLTIERLDHFDERFDVFWAQMVSMYPVMVARTRSYLNWRYVARPDVSYTIYEAHYDGTVQGYVVLALRRQAGVRGLIADILAVDVPTTRALLSQALEHFFTVGVDMITVWALPENELYKTLRQLGFVERGIAAPLVCMAFDHEAVDEVFLCNPRNWYVTMGDSDGV